MNANPSFEDLIQEYHPIIYKMCRVYSDSYDFEDLYQEILIAIWKSMSSFHGKAKWSTWIYRVALNTAMTYERNNKKSKTFFHVDNELIERSGSPEKQEQSISKEELYTAISKLNKSDRSLILLYLEERTYEDIAEILGLSVSNVGVKINRAKKKLLTILSGVENG